MPPLSAQPENIERRRALPIERENWERHKNILRKLLQEKKLPWKDIITYMQENHNFQATEAQYHKQLREWGIFKNKKRKRPGNTFRRAKNSLTQYTERSREEPEVDYVDGDPQDEAAVGSTFHSGLTRHIASATQPYLDEVQYGTDSSANPMVTGLGRSLGFPLSNKRKHGKIVQSETTRSPTTNPEFRFPNSQISISTTQNAAHHTSNDFQGFNDSRASNSCGSFTTMPMFGIDDFVDGMLYANTGNYQTARQSLSTNPDPCSLPTSLPVSCSTQPYQQQHSAAQSNTYDKLFQLGDYPPIPQFNNLQGKKGIPDNNKSIHLSTATYQPINLAAAAGSVRGVELLLKTDPECVNALDEVGASALVLAAGKGYTKIVKLLLDHGSNANLATTNYHTTALHLAALNGSVDVVRLLLDSKAEPDLMDGHNLTPLWFAAQIGYLEIVKILLEKNANPNVKSTPDLSSPIHEAAINGHLEVVKLLLEAGAEPDEGDVDDLTPLWYASQEGYHEIVELLLEIETIKCNVETAWKGKSLRTIHQAAQNGHLKVVELLLKYGAKADPEKAICDDTVPSPVCLAADNGHVAIARLLVERGADINFSLKPSGRRPLHFAAQRGHAEFVRFAIEKEADLNARDEKGWRPLMFAAQEDYLEIVALLIEGGANVNAKDNNGKTALWIASKRGHVYVVEKLLRSGAKSFQAIASSTRPIHEAAHNGHLAVVKLLIENDLNELEVEDINGLRPLTLASWKSNEDNYFEMMEYLIKKGAKPLG